MSEAPAVKRHAYGAITELAKLKREPRILIEGPANCVAGETELWDPIAERGRRIDDLCEAGGRPWVMTLDGPELAEAPFVKGFAPLFRVTLENGRSCVATAGHRFLARGSQAGPAYVYLSDLAPGMELLSARGAGVPRSTGIAPGSQDGCQRGSRSCGAPPHVASVGGRVRAPLPGDARALARAGWLAGAQEATRERTRSCRLSDRLASADDARRAQRAPSGLLLPAEYATLAARCHAESSIHVRASSWSQPSAQWRQGTPQRQPSPQRSNGGGCTRSRGHARSWSPCADYDPKWDRIATIEYVRDDFYFDLTVPRAGHYLADGIFSKNTGKTSGILWWMEMVHAWHHPGIRILILRQTMKSLRESILATLEDKVWAPLMRGRRHPAQHGTATRWNRSTYQYPNGTTIVIGGLEDPGWTYSMEYDLILAFEAWEISRDAAERLFRANRNHVLCRYAPWNAKLAELVQGQWLEPTWARWHGVSDMDELAQAPDEVRASLVDGQSFGCWQQTIFDTNPGPKFHWLNQAAAPLDALDATRIKEKGEPSRRVFFGGMFTRVLSRHGDNPACTPDDLEKLDMMSGSRHANLRLGLWESAEGQIWPAWDPTVHMLIGVVERYGERDPGNPIDERKMKLVFKGERGKNLPESVEIKWAFASLDFGWRNAGVLQVWLADYQDRIYRAVEIHRREMIDDWWSEQLAALHAEFNLYGAVADCPDPERIVKMNDRLEGFKGRKGQRIVCGVDKSLKRGSRVTFIPTKLDLVRDMLNPEQPGGPRMYWLHDAMREYPCPIAAEKMLPRSSTEEIPGYTFKAHEDGVPDKEEPDKACPQDGCDATAYAAVYFWMMDPIGRKATPGVVPGTAAWRLRHDLVHRKVAPL